MNNTHVKPLIIGVIALALVAGSTVFALRMITPKQAFQYLSVQRQDVTRTVAVTGRVKAASDANLAFERSGKVASVSVKVGDHVKADQSLVTLSATDLDAQRRQTDAQVATAKAGVLQAQAALAREQAHLDEVKRGARPEDIAVQQAQLDAAQSAVTDAQTALLDKLADAATKADDAVRSKVDQLFTNPRSASPHFSLFVPDTALQTESELARADVEILLNGWQTKVMSLKAATDDLLVAGDEAKTDLAQVRKLLDDVAFILDSVSVSPTLTQTALDGYKTNLSTARANVNLATTNIIAAQERVRTAATALKTAQQQMNLKQAGSTTEQVDAQAATVSQMQANVAAAQAQQQSAEAALAGVQAQFAKMTLRAPFDGTVTRFDPTVGEIVSPNVPVVAVMAETQYEIEATVSEAEIAEIKVGVPAKVTLDAYGDSVVFDAAVSDVDPAETVVNGVPAYNIKLRFVNNDDRIKSGLTANVKIVIGTHASTLVLPRQAVVIRNGEAFVLVQEGTGTTEKKVTLGWQGKGDLVEILSGLADGDQVVSFGAR
jgi:HlyD family secretion protein